MNIREKWRKQIKLLQWQPKQQQQQKTNKNQKQKKRKDYLTVLLKKHSKKMVFNSSESNKRQGLISISKSVEFLKMNKIYMKHTWLHILC